MNQPVVTKSTRDIGTQIRELTLAILCSAPFGFLFMGAGWMLVTIPDRYQAEVDFRARALLTSGTVVRRKQVTNCYATGGFGVSCTSSCDLKVEFINNGKIAEFWDSCYKSANENQAVPVLYDPMGVSKTRIDRGDTPESLARDQFFASIAAGLLGISLLTYFSPTENNQKQT